jgi:SAM-dependent methyltransferase
MVEGASGSVSGTCPFCHEPAIHEFRTHDVNRQVTTEQFSYLRCRACGLLALSPVPVNLERYYPTEYYDAMPWSRQRLDRIAEANRYQIEMVQRFIPAGRLLEIGPGYGVFAHLAKKSGFDVEVIEMSDRCCKHLTEVVGVKAINSNRPADVLKTAEPKDVIVLWHVIEHLPDAWECLASAAHNLAPGGILLIATPNPDALQFHMMGSAWPHVDAPRHLYLIPASVVIQRLRPLGLEPVLLTTNDKGGLSWNRFGWQRYFMNRFSSKPAQLAAFAAGYLISVPMALWDRRELKGSAYTLILQKVG